MTRLVNLCLVAGVLLAGVLFPVVGGRVCCSPGLVITSRARSRYPPPSNLRR